VYGCMKINLPCEPMTEYHFELAVRSRRNDGGCWFGGGRNWAWINPIPMGEYDWSVLNGWYRTGPDETSIPFMLHVNGTSEIDFDSIVMTRVGPSSDPTVRPAYTALDVPALQANLERLKTAQPDRRSRLSALAARSGRVDYPQAKLAYLDAFLPIVEKRLAQGGYERACTAMLDEMNQLAAAFDRDVETLERNPSAYPAVPRYRSGRVIPDGYAMTAEVFDPETGETGRRPAILNGFGHFFTVVDELEKWPERGCNFIQIEYGPQNVERQPDGTLRLKPDTLEQLLETFRRAEACNVSVSLLLSPHYLPNEAGGMWYGDEPGPWAYYRALISRLLPLIRDSKSLHSIILSNEPHCFAGPDDPSLIRAWRDFLPRKYADIDALNRAYGSSFRDFSEVPIPSAELDRGIADTPLSPVESIAGKFSREQRPWLYDYVVCKQERFGEWHRRMAALVKEFAPDVPVHAKVTGGYYMGHPVADGVDFEQFSEFTDYHGFDEVGGVRIIYDWAASLKPAPSINTENHLLQPDYTFDEIDHERIYADLFAQAMHGQTASATWVYEPWYDPLATNTCSMRPACMEAISRCGMDLMRVSEELAALQQSSGGMAILTSPLSWWYDDRSHAVWRGSWSAFYDTGLRVGFRTEKQLAEGEFDGIGLLVLPETTVLEPETVAALKRFVAGGGKLLAVGDVPAFYPGWRPIPAGELPEIADRIALSADWNRKLVDAAAEYGIRPAWRLIGPDGPSRGIHYLSGTFDGKPLVVALNAATGREMTVIPEDTATGKRPATAYDALSGRTVTFPVTIPPNQAAVWLLD